MSVMESHQVKSCKLLWESYLLCVCYDVWSYLWFVWLMRCTGLQSVTGRGRWEVRGGEPGLAGSLCPPVYLLLRSFNRHVTQTGTWDQTSKISFYWQNSCLSVRPVEESRQKQEKSPTFLVRTRAPLTETGALTRPNCQLTLSGSRSRDLLDQIVQDQSVLMCSQSPNKIIL